MKPDTIKKVMLLRLNILPPYSLDGDEGEKDVNEYIGFFDRHLLNSLTATDQYLKALKEFASNIESTTLYNKLMKARRAFIGSFPFTTDELGTEAAEFEDQMRGIYKIELQKGKLIANLEEYRKALANLN